MDSMFGKLCVVVWYIVYYRRSVLGGACVEQ